MLKSFELTDPNSCMSKALPASRASHQSTGDEVGNAMAVVYMTPVVAVVCAIAGVVAYLKWS